MSDLDRLEQVAREATEGPWWTEAVPTDDRGTWQHGVKAESRWVVVFAPWLPSVTDAIYLETFDPSTTLALIDRLRRSERFIEDIAKQRCYETETERGGCAPCEADTLLVQLRGYTSDQEEADDVK